jgi:hypothetical protein
MVALPTATGVTTPLLTVATEVFVLVQLTFVLVALDGLIVAVRVPVDPPAGRFNVVGLRLTPVTGTFVVPTVTAHVAVLPPSAVVTVTVEVPGDTGVTTPTLVTVATDVFVLVQLTFVLVAFDGVIVAARVPVEPPTSMFKVVGLRLTPITGMLVVPIVTAHVAVLAPSTVVTVTIEVPGDTGVTTPMPLTVAIEVLVLVQLTFVLVALDGVIVAIRLPVEPPTNMLKVVGLMLTPVTETPAGGLDRGGVQLHNNRPRRPRTGNSFLSRRPLVPLETLFIYQNLGLLSRKSVRQRA